MIVAQRLRKGSCGSPRGADRLFADAITTTRRLPGLQHQKLLVRADSAFYGRPSIACCDQGWGGCVGHRADDAQHLPRDHHDPGHVLGSD